MKFYMTGMSAAAVAMAMAWPAAAQQDQGENAPQGGERAAAELTCQELSMMDTARIPGALYFIAGHQAGSGEAGTAEDGDQQAADGTTGEESPTVRLQGFFEIAIEDTILACAEAPDTPVADVIARQGDATDGGPGTGGTGTGDAAMPADSGAGGEAAGGTEPASGEETGNGDTGNVSTTPDADSTRGGEILSPEEAGDSAGTADEGDSNN